MVFTVGGQPIERVRKFRYLGRILSERDDDTLSIEDQLKRAKRRWGRISKVLKRDGANATVMARFYMAIVQAVLLYGADLWTITQDEPWFSMEGEFYSAGGAKAF